MPELSTTSTARNARNARIARTSAVSRRLTVCAALTLLGGLAGGVAWMLLADPADWVGREGGIVLTEAAARGQFSVIVTFVAVGAVVSIVSGWAVARCVPDLGWFAVPVVVVLTALAGLVAWRVGVELGPPPPDTVQGVATGERVPAQLAVDGVAPFLVWPIFGVLGVIVASWADGRHTPES